VAEQVAGVVGQFAVSSISFEGGTNYRDLFVLLVAKEQSNVD